MRCGQGGEHDPMVQTGDRMTRGNHSQDEPAPLKEPARTLTCAHPLACRRQLRRRQSRHPHQPGSTARQPRPQTPGTSSPSGSRSPPRHKTIQRSQSWWLPSESPASTLPRRIPPPGRAGQRSAGRRPRPASGSPAQGSGPAAEQTANQSRAGARSSVSPRNKGARIRASRIEAAGRSLRLPAAVAGGRTQSGRSSRPWSIFTPLHPANLLHAKRYLTTGDMAIGRQHLPVDSILTCSQLGSACSQGVRRALLLNCQRLGLAIRSAQ